MNKPILAAALSLGLLVSTSTQAEHKDENTFYWSLNNNIDGIYSRDVGQPPREGEIENVLKQGGCALVGVSVDYMFKFEGFPLSDNVKIIKVFYRSIGEVADNCVRDSLEHHEIYPGSYLMATEVEGLYRIIKNTK